MGVRSEKWVTGSAVGLEAAGIVRGDSLLLLLLLFLGLPPAPARVLLLLLVQPLQIVVPGGVFRESALRMARQEHGGR